MSTSLLFFRFSLELPFPKDGSHLLFIISLFVTNPLLPADIAYLLVVFPSLALYRIWW